MKYLILPALIIAGIAADAQQITRPFTLTGQITNQQEGIIYLIYEGEAGKRMNDSTPLKDGQFRFTGKIAEPVMAFLSCNSRRLSMDDPNATNFFMEPGNMKLKAAYGNLKEAQITGSITQAEYNVYQQQQNKLRRRWQVVMDTLHAINTRSNAQFQETKAWALTPYEEEQKEITASFIKRYPASYVTAYLLRFERSLSTDSIKKIYARFPEQVKQSSYGKEIVAALEKRKIGVPGTKAAVFTSTGLDGHPVSLADYKGKYVLVDFWASWCVPCRKGNPHLKELYARYKDKGFEVIGVSDDDSKPEAWKKAVEQDALPWKHVLRGLKIIRNGETFVGFDRSKDISDSYNISSLPTQVLIDANGMIIGRYGGDLGEDHEALDKKLEAIFK